MSLLQKDCLPGVCCYAISTLIPSVRYLTKCLFDLEKKLTEKIFKFTVMLASEKQAICRSGSG